MTFDLIRKLIFISVFFSISCSKNDFTDNFEKDIHDQLSTNVEITLTKKGNVTAKIKSEVLKKNNQSLQLELFDNVNVDLFDENFQQKSLIKSQSAMVNEKENKIKAYGSVVVISDDGKILMTDSLTWDNNSDKIYTDANLEFITSDSDTLYGTGFKSNIDLTIGIFCNLEEELIMTKVLKAENLVKKYGDFYAVNDIDLNLKKGEVVGLLGPNGAGKTTTFYMITGMIRPSSGKIIFGDKDITKSPMYKRARMGIGYLAQEPSIFGKLSVEDNLKIVLETIISSKEEQNNLIDKLLNEFNISHIRNNMGAGLSGGERRRVEICRTLALKPDFVLLDEPFAGVDPIAVEDIQQMIISLKQQNIGVLITDHNVRETLSITDRSYLLHGGKILKSGDAQTLANDEEVRRIYLGKNFKLDQ